METFSTENPDRVINIHYEDMKKVWNTKQALQVCNYKLFFLFISQNLLGPNARKPVFRVYQE